MSTRAKFACVRVTNDVGGSNIELNVIYDPKGNEENKNFTKYTPSGEIKMRVDNPGAAVQFKPGRFYYVDFNEVPDEVSNQLPND